MQRVYSVKINGRTLESRNIRELLARAVNAKRNPGRRIMIKDPLYSRMSVEDSSGAYAQTGMAVVH